MLDPEARFVLALTLLGVAWLVIIVVLFMVGATVTVDGHHYVVKLGG